MTRISQSYSVSLTVSHTSEKLTIIDSVIFGPDQLPTDGNVLTMTLEKVSPCMELADH